MERVTCSTCGKVVQPSRGYRCPQCHAFLPPDPHKRKEAELTTALREWFIQENPTKSKTPDVPVANFPES